MPNMSVHSLEFQLLNDYQQRFPLCSRPFAHIAETLGSAEAAVLQTYSQLVQAGRISRIGAVFTPQRIGASTLAALSIPPERLAAVAAMVSQFPEVNHNYEREHRFNLWFVVTANATERLHAVLTQIEANSGLSVLRLPLEAQFHIDLGFNLKRTHHTNLAEPACAATLNKAAPPATHETYLPDAAAQALINALQGGLALVAQPYALLAQQLGWSEQQVLEHIQTWLNNGLLKRFGVVVRHHELGYTANAMVVHNIPDALVQQLGHQLGQHPGVTLCYQRPRVGSEWPYNLFCMLHGRERPEVERQIAELRATHGLQDYAFDVLFSRTRYKQQGAYYANGAPTTTAHSAVEA